MDPQDARQHPETPRANSNEGKATPKAEIIPAFASEDARLYAAWSTSAYALRDKRRKAPDRNPVILSQRATPTPKPRFRTAPECDKPGLHADRFIDRPPEILSRRKKSQSQTTTSGAAITMSGTETNIKAKPASKPKSVIAGSIPPQDDETKPCLDTSRQTVARGSVSPDERPEPENQILLALRPNPSFDPEFCRLPSLWSMDIGDLRQSDPFFPPVGKFAKLSAGGIAVSLLIDSSYVREPVCIGHDVEAYM
ncbi:hypothetical protein BCV70DRAFT_121093 [Testicularia cyperi]|uniref:Uncharacterized protein n=1 Tax=Testicularia cyperi TaxID=1882483 RepID=A0A317XKT4_9BASI|nr:hypothetical protein BCV70DRAFT_121093 [Testicularia cyperi]